MRFNNAGSVETANFACKGRKIESSKIPLFIFGNQMLNWIKWKTVDLKNRVQILLSQFYIFSKNVVTSNTNEYFGEFDQSHCCIVLDRILRKRWRCSNVNGAGQFSRVTT